MQIYSLHRLASTVRVGVNTDFWLRQELRVSQIHNVCPSVSGVFQVSSNFVVKTEPKILHLTLIKSTLFETLGLFIFNSIFGVFSQFLVLQDSALRKYRENGIAEQERSQEPICFYLILSKISPVFGLPPPGPLCIRQSSWSVAC